MRRINVQIKKSLFSARSSSHSHRVSSPLKRSAFFGVRAYVIVTLLVVGAIGPIAGSAQDGGAPLQLQTVGGAWQPVGPAPSGGGQSENVTPDNEVVGAVHTAAAHPTNANILYIGAVNGGIWKTTNATATSPVWVQQTDPQASLSIGALEFDPTDATAQTLVAGIGRFSSFGRRGGARIGLLKTSNGGASWTTLDGGGTLAGKNISGVAPRGNTIVVSANTGDNSAINQLGIFRTVNGGTTFTQISSGNGSVTGLPAGITFDLAGDPANPARLFTAVVSADTAGGQNGLYRSTNTGATWTKVSNAAMDSLMITGTTSNIEIAAGRSNNVFVAIANSGRLAGVFRSGDGGTTWTAMDVPSIHPGGQASIHLSIATAPTNANIVYLGGDRQNLPGDLQARNFSGRLFRGDASRAQGSQFVHLTHSRNVGPAGGGTISASSPHADSRELVVDAAGNLIETDDGGVYRRTNPLTNNGDWFSINSNLQIMEFHSIAYDSNTNSVIGGEQDNGSSRELQAGGTSWRLVNGGDGGDVAIDDRSTAGLSSRYHSSQNLGGLRRQVYNSSNVLQTQVSPDLALVGGGLAPQATFTTPIEVNAVTGTRLIIGAANAAFESLDQGETIRQLTPAIPITGSGTHPIAYGAGTNADALYLGSADQVWIRTAPPPAPLVRSTAFPGTGLTVVDIVMNPTNPSIAYVINSSSVFQTLDAGASWTNITGNLPSFNPGTLRSLDYIINATGEGVAVGSNTGVFVALGSSGFTVWDKLGTGFPTAPVLDLDYDRADDLLVAGTLGRGAWTLSRPSFASPAVFSATFDAGVDGFTFVDDAFGTSQPAYAAGSFVNPGGFTGGGLRATVGGVDSNVVNNMSGGWRRSFNLSTPQLVTLAFDFNMTQTSEYESDEFSEALVQIDNQTVLVQVRVTGNGNGGTPLSTGAISRVLNLGCLAAGTHTVTIGLRNNKKTFNNESTDLLLDNIVVRTSGSCQTP